MRRQFKWPGWPLALVLAGGVSGLLAAEDEAPLDKDARELLELLEFLDQFSDADGQWHDPLLLDMELPESAEGQGRQQEARPQAVPADNQ